MAFADERPKSEGLSSRPINVLSFVNSLDSVRKDTLQISMDLKAFGGIANDCADVLQSMLGHSGRVVWQNLGSKLLGRLEAVPCRSGPFLRSGLVFLALCKAL